MKMKVEGHEAYFSELERIACQVQKMATDRHVCITVSGQGAGMNMTQKIQKW